MEENNLYSKSIVLFKIVLQKSKTISVCVNRQTIVEFFKSTSVESINAFFRNHFFGLVKLLRNGELRFFPLLVTMNHQIHLGKRATEFIPTPNTQIQSPVCLKQSKNKPFAVKVVTVIFLTHKRKLKKKKIVIIHRKLHTDKELRSPAIH